MALWSRLFSGVFGVGVGIAAADALTPSIEVKRQEAWANNAFRQLDPGQLAQLVAEGLVGLEQAQEEGKRNGYGPDKLAALAQLSMHGPAVAEAIRMLRRKAITPEQFAHAIRKAGIEPQYDAAIVELLDERLDPAVIALAIVRGIMDDPGFLPVGPPASEGKVKAFPTSPLDSIDEAAASGVNRQRLFVQTAIAGRPMGPEAAAAAVFRDIIERVDYNRAIAEGDVRNEWAEAIFETSRQIPSVADYVNARIRGWITTPQMHAGVARHGMSPEDSDLLLLRTGRPATVHQVHIGYARGGRNPDIGNDEQATARKAVQESDIRPEWFDLLWAGRYTMPSAFVLRALTQDGTFTGAQAENILLESGWRPDLAKAAADKWSGAGPAASTKWLDRARSRLFTTAHNEFLNLSIDDSQADALLAQLGASAAERPAIIELWTAERIINRLELTPAQIKKAYRAALYDQPRALAELEERGMTPDDAQTFLDE